MPVGTPNQMKVNRTGCSVLRCLPLFIVTYVHMCSCMWVNKCQCGYIVDIIMDVYLTVMLAFKQILDDL